MNQNNSSLIIQLETSKDRSLKAAFEKLQNLKDKLSLSEMTTETAAYIYRKALMKGLHRGRSIDSVVVGAAYIAIGETPTPIPLKEISQASNIRQKYYYKNGKINCLRT